MFPILNTNSQSLFPLHETDRRQIDQTAADPMSKALRISQQWSLITTLPEFFIQRIVSFCDQNTLLRLSETTKIIKLISDLARKKLLVTIPLDLDRWQKNQIENVKTSILGDLLTRFSCITDLSCPRLDEFFVDIINDFLGFLKAYYPTHLRHVILYEIKSYSILWDDTQAPQLNQKYLNAFSHLQLLSLKMIANRDRLSNITDVMINSVLEKSTNLVSFTFDGFLTGKNIIFYLSNCPKLERVRLNGKISITSATIEQLGRCLNLRELSIDAAHDGISKLEQFLCTKHQLKLKVLNLRETNCLTTDEALHLSTRYLPDLEFFSRQIYYEDDQNQISDRGLVQLANNCEKLTTLIFNFTNITDEGLTHFAANAPQLRKLSMFEMHLITHKGLLGLTQHCKQLEALELSHLKNLNLAVLSVLIENCKNLIFLNIRNCDCRELPVADLRSFIKSCQSLKYLRIFDGVFHDRGIRPLIEEFFPDQWNPLRFEDI